MYKRSNAIEQLPRAFSTAAACSVHDERLMMERFAGTKNKYFEQDFGSS
jgi:hypothetical protein